MASGNGVAEMEANSEKDECSEGNTKLLVPNFIKPERFVLKPDDMSNWFRSEAYRDYVGFIATLNESIKGKSTKEMYISDAANKVLEIIRTLDKWIEEVPPIQQPQRFGNKAFRDWFARVNDNAEDLLSPLLQEEFKGAVIELKAYFCDGFGNQTRIDYGTGHEAAFCAFLCCLYKLRILTQKDEATIVFKIFQEYIELTRKLQINYRMEPAGSQGVWGLDDFHFLPFIWGSGQLVDHAEIYPIDLVNKTRTQQLSEEYMFFDCIKHINATKSGPFAEHSNILWSISSIPHWEKVNSGLIKMYKVEVLKKFPVMQHFLFGTLMSNKQV